MSVDLSIVIPAYNEEELLPQCLSAIRDHLQGINHETIVVDNGSIDSTVQAASNFPPTQVISIPKSTIGRARNAGARIASGRLLAFLDADIRLTPRWRDAIAGKLAVLGPDAEYFGGYPVDIPDTASLIERAWFRASSQGKLSYIGSANLVITTALFRRLGGFDETLRSSEDVDLGHRIRREGLQSDREPGLYAIHLGFPRTLRDFVKREMWHGLGSYRTMTMLLHSKVTIGGIGSQVFLVAGVLFLALGRVAAGSVLVLAHLFLPLLFIWYKFRFKDAKYVGVRYLLSYLFLAARAASGVCAVIKPSLSGHRMS